MKTIYKSRVHNLYNLVPNSKLECTVSFSFIQYSNFKALLLKTPRRHGFLKFCNKRENFYPIRVYSCTCKRTVQRLFYLKNKFLKFMYYLHNSNIQAADLFTRIFLQVILQRTLAAHFCYVNDTQTILRMSRCCMQSDNGDFTKTIHQSLTQ